MGAEYYGKAGGGHKYSDMCWRYIQGNSRSGFQVKNEEKRTRERRNSCKDERAKTDRQTRYECAMPGRDRCQDCAWPGGLGLVELYP